MEDKNGDIIITMFASNLDEILQTVFLFLDPASLKDARCVCHQWNNFIINRLWGSKVARKKLESRFYYRWRNQTDVKIKHLAHHNEKGVNNLDCDDEFVYCGTLDGIIEVFCISTGKLVCKLDCDYVEHFENYELYLDVGITEIATLTGGHNPNIRVWDKITGEILYDLKIKLLSEMKVISRGAVLLGFFDGSLALIMGNKENRWSLENKFMDIRQPILGIDSDGYWVVTATSSAVHLWNFTNNSIVLDPRSVQLEFGELGMVALSFPYIYIVGGDEWAGLQVWNIDSKQMLRHVDINDCYFHHIKLNGRFILISDLSWPSLSALIFDKKELCDIKLTDDTLWRNTYIYANVEEGIVEDFAALNTTGLVIINSKSITVQNYWDA